MATIARGDPLTRLPGKVPAAARFSIRRTASLIRRNALLLSRNRLAILCVVLMPVLPLALLFTGERGSPAVGAVVIIIMFQVIALIPIQYTGSGTE
ncbi:hypothetical protein ABLG96_07950 [Nakamurella sp. A5-74]|uniref:ABC transporter permease n=1 Tax=Nakamurella sp. A5-74 TaxID=3158264 RepID=A0AAU8DTN9_9ACTN